MTAKGRIAAATYRITLANAGYSIYFTMRQTMLPLPRKKLSLPRGILTPQLLHGFLDPPESVLQTAPRSVQPFCSAHGCDKQTDRQTYKPRNIGNNRPHLSTPYIRCRLIIKDRPGSGDAKSNSLKATTLFTLRTCIRASACSTCEQSLTHFN